MTKYKRDGYVDRYYNKRDHMVVDDYIKADTTVEKLAIKYNLSSRSIQRICKKSGVVRTIAESNKLMAKFKNYDGHKIPDSLKAKRKTLPKNLRYKILRDHPYCSIDGRTIKECPLQVDHIDGDASNNDPSNLQVLCMECNYGKR